MAALGSNRQGSSTETYAKTYTTFSGADITCTFNGTQVAEIAGITWSVTREKAPVFTMGSPNPRSFSRGKRGIAGSLIFMTFDRPALYNLIAAQAAQGGDVGKIWTRNWNLLPNMSSNSVASGIAAINDSRIGISSALPYYADQVLPFDVTISFSNEYGNAAVKSIYGVELLNEGSGASMDDLVIEETMTFVAREIGPMIPTTRNFDVADAGISTDILSGFGLGSG